LHPILVRSVMGEPRRRLEHKISLYRAASEVRYIVIFNNGSTTEPNGVSELSLAPHRVTMLTTKHSPAEIARKKSKVGVECSPVSCELLDCRLQSLSRTTNFAARIFSSGNRKCCLLVPCQHTQKKTGGGAYYVL
jgi:hypothetical protein